MNVSVVIPHFGRQELLDACMAALEANTPDHELIVVDNNAMGGSFAQGCNVGFDESNGDVVVFLNNDTEVRAGWLEPLLMAFDESYVGIAGSKLLYPDDRVQHAGVDVFLANGVLTAEHASVEFADVRRYVPAVTGACMAVRRECFVECGGFDEDYDNGLEDIDLCLKADARNWVVVYEPASVVMHHESASGPARWRSVHQNIRRFDEKWRGSWQPTPSTS